MRRAAAQPVLGQQRRLERAGDRLLALARSYGVADHDDGLSGARQRLEATGSRRAAPGNRTSRAVSAFDNSRAMPGQRAAPLSSAQVAKGAEAEAIGGAGRDHDTIERRQHARIGGHIRCETKHDALHLAGRHHVVDVARKTSRRSPRPPGTAAPCRRSGSCRRRARSSRTRSPCCRRRPATHR